MLILSIDIDLDSELVDLNYKIASLIFCHFWRSIRDVNEHSCGVERSKKITLTLSFRWGRNFRHFWLEAQTTSNVPFKTFSNSFDSFFT